MKFSKLLTRQAGDRSLKRGLTTKIHVASTSAKSALDFTLSPGNNHDAPEGCRLLGIIYSLKGKKRTGFARIFAVWQGKNPPEYQVVFQGFSTQSDGKKTAKAVWILPVKEYIFRR